MQHLWLDSSRCSPTLSLYLPGSYMDQKLYNIILSPHFLSPTYLSVIAKTLRTITRTRGLQIVGSFIPGLTEQDPLSFHIPTSTPLSMMHLTWLPSLFIHLPQPPFLQPPTLTMKTIESLLSFYILYFLAVVTQFSELNLSLQIN